MPKYRYFEGTNSPHEYKVCKGCGEEKWIRQGRYFCSRSCYDVSRKETAKYQYFGQPGNPREYKICEYCGERAWIMKLGRFCSVQCSKMKGNQVGYSAFHFRVYKRKGKAFGCAQCGLVDSNTRYEWANLTGHYEDVDDYVSMCQPCHGRYDSERRSIKCLQPS
jgi:hypothetical protein